MYIHLSAVVFLGVLAVCRSARSSWGFLLLGLRLDAFGPDRLSVLGFRGFGLRVEGFRV